MIDHPVRRQATAFLACALMAEGLLTSPTPAADRPSNAAETLHRLPPGPWVKSLGPDAPEPTEADLFRLPRPRPPLDEAELRTWFTTGTGPPPKVVPHPQTGALTIEGSFRLVPPLRAGTALRMLLADASGLRIVAWSGNRAAAIENERQTAAHRWCGSVLTRPAADKPVDARWLASTADARAFRSGANMNLGQPAVSLELRYLDGALVLSRGEVRLVEVPLPAEPDEVLFEGSYAIIGLELVRAVAPPPLPERSAVTTEWRPADIVWEGSGKDAVEKRADGSVRLAQPAAAAPAPTPLVVTWKLPSPELGPREIVFKIDECGPGTGIYLANPEGQGGFVLGFVAPAPGGPPERGGLLMAMWSPADKGLLTGGDPGNGLNFVPRPVWLRLTTFDQTLVISWSGDGRNWARPRWFPRLASLGGIGTVGLFVGGHPGATISLARLAAADLPGLARLLPRDLLPAVNPALVTEPDPKRMVDWQAATLKAKPDGVDADRWLAAAAIRCLATNCTNLTGGLKAIVWRYAQAADCSLADRLDVCDDLNRLSTCFGNGDAWVSTAPYCVLARDCVDRGDVEGFRTIWLRLMQAPSDINYLWGFGQQVDIIDTRGRLVRRLLVTDAGGDLPEELARQRYYEGNAGFATAVALQLDDGNPVVFEPDRRLSNVAREFTAAVAVEDWPDAQRAVARQLAEGGAAATAQLIRHSDDPNRLVTLPVLVTAALRDHPAYRDAVQGDPAERGMLRIRSVAAAGDADAMAVAGVEFAGTPAAAEAHEWLAARALASGDAVTAREHALAGLVSATAETAGRLASIQALAELVGGAGVRTRPQAGLPGAATAEIATAVAQAPARDPVAERLPKAGDLEATKRLDLVAEPPKDGSSSHADSIRNPIDERLGVFSSPPFFRQRLDWGAEVCTISAAPGRLLVNNRIELVSLDLATAAVQWRLPPGPKPGGIESVGPGLVAMRPCWDDRHVYFRRLAHGNAPTVAAVRLADGGVVWEPTAAAPHPPISDPVLVDGGLQFFEARPGIVDELTFVVVDPASGRRKHERIVAGLRPAWRVRRAKLDAAAIEAGDCQVTAADGRLYVTIGGSVFCCQADGHVRWARHLPWLNAEADGWWRYQAQTPPLVHDGKVFLMQPGFPGIAAVDAADGRLLWKQPLVGPRRLIGLAGVADAVRLVVETADGILACDPRDGATRMLLEARDGTGEFGLGIAATRLLGAALPTSDGHVVALVQQRRADTAATGMLDVAVVWVDAATGAVQKTADLPALAGKPPWAGPLAAAGGRLWTLTQAQANDLRRTLWELAPRAAP